MSKGVKIPGYKSITKNEKLGVCNKPKYVYIPLINQNDTDITVLVKKGDYVYKGTHIGRRKGNLKIPIISTVSGTVVDFVSRTYHNGMQVRCVQIENDFKEKYEENRMIRKERVKLTKQEFIDLLHDNAVIGMGGAGFPTYVKYSTDKARTLLVNAVECEPFITADYALVKAHPEELLESIDMILESNHMDECVIAIKKTNTELIGILNNFIGTYVKIKIVPVLNVYPMGWERNLIREVFHVEYNQLPIEKGIIVNNISTIYAIYEALKFNRPLTERIVTFTGFGLEKPQNILVKIGMEAKEALPMLTNTSETVFVAGGPMMGSSIPDDSLVISSDVNCVLVLPNTPDKKAITCMRCGKCVATCPAKLSPVLIKENRNNISMLKKLEVNRCIECGLCSYICPSKILVRDYVIEAKKILKGCAEDEK